MSLLNEALRKNRSEKNRQVIYVAPSQVANYPKRALIYIILFLVLTAGFSYMWIMENHNVSAPPEIRNEPVNSIMNSISEPVSPSVNKGTAEKDRALNMVKVTEKRIPLKVTQAAPDIETKPATVSDKKVQALEVAIDKGTAAFHSEQPENEEYFLQKALQLHRQAKPEAALIMYKKATELNPSNSEALFNMASIYITLARYQDAYDILLSLATSNKADTKTMLNLSVAEIGLTKYMDAISHLETLNEDDPELLFEIFFHRGVALSRIGRPDEAIKNYMDAEKINSNHPALLLNMAVLYDRYGRYDEATAYYKKLINSDSLKPGEMGIYKNRIEQLRAHLPVSDGNGSGKEIE